MGERRLVQGVSDLGTVKDDKGNPWQIAAIVLAIVVSLVRMYVAARLPLDLIGGAALGVTVASAVNLLLGFPTLAPAEDFVREQIDDR